MSAPQTKRKVMGRINISQNGSSNDLNASTPSRSYGHSARASTSSPGPGSFSGPRIAKVDPSTIVGSHAEGASGRSSFSQGVGNAYDSHISSIRSPLSSAHGTASPIPSKATSSFARQVRTRQSTRSPSPSYTSPSTRPGSSTNNEASISTRPRVRPTSVLLSQREATQALRSAQPHVAKATVTTDLTIKGHGLPADATRSIAPQNLDVRDVSRSPSPTIVRAAPNRRISHGSNVSTGGTSSLSSPQTSEAAGRRQSALLEASVKRPSLSSLRANGSARITPDYPSHAARSTIGLESPLDLVSPMSREPPSSFGNAYFTTPAIQNTMQSPNAALLSPTTDLDAEAVEAKTKRKILDLEITNKSLLAINSGLEVTKLKQAREIRDLRRRLREGRGLGDRLGLETGEGADAALTSATEDEDELSEEENEETPLNAELEEAHQRCKLLIDTMVSQARHAIMSTYESERRSAGNRVLHPAELDGFGTNHETHEEDDPHDADVDVDAGALSQSISGLTQESSEL